MVDLIESLGAVTGAIALDSEERVQIADLDCAGCLGPLPPPYGRVLCQQCSLAAFCSPRCRAAGPHARRHDEVCARVLVPALGRAAGVQWSFEKLGQLREAGQGLANRHAPVGDPYWEVVDAAPAILPLAQDESVLQDDDGGGGGDDGGGGGGDGGSAFGSGFSSGFSSIFGSDGGGGADGGSDGGGGGGDGCLGAAGGGGGVVGGGAGGQEVFHEAAHEAGTEDVFDEMFAEEAG